MGWNKLNVKKNCPILKDMDGGIFLFCSFIMLILDEEVISGVTDYGVDLVASLSNNNCFATQFHPEKKVEFQV